MSSNGQGKSLKTFINRFNEISEKLDNLTVDYMNLTSKVTELENKIIQIEKIYHPISIFSQLNLINEIGNG